MENNKIDDSSIFENVIFENNYGLYNKNYIHLKRKNKTLKINQIAFLEIININKNKNILRSTIIITLLIGISFYMELLTIIPFTSLFTISILFYFFSKLNKRNHYLKVTNCNPKIYFLKIEKSELNDAYRFSKSFSIYRQLNPEL